MTQCSLVVGYRVSEEHNAFSFAVQMPSVLKVEIACSSGTPVTTYNTTWYHIPKNHNINLHKKTPIILQFGLHYAREIIQRRLLFKLVCSTGLVCLPCATLAPCSAVGGSDGQWGPEFVIQRLKLECQKQSEHETASLVYHTHLLSFWWKTISTG